MYLCSLLCCCCCFDSCKAECRCLVGMFRRTGYSGITGREEEPEARICFATVVDTAGGGRHPSGAAAPGCPRSWWGRSQSCRAASPRTSCRLSCWSAWWYRPPWSPARPHSRGRNRRVRGSRAGPWVLDGGREERKITLEEGPEDVRCCV